jgi:hypothetical protein
MQKEVGPYRERFCTMRWIKRNMAAVCLMGIVGVSAYSKDTHDENPQRIIEQARFYRIKIEGLMPAIEQFKREQLVQLLHELQEWDTRLSYARELLSVWMAQTSASYVADVQETMKVNLEGTGLDLSDVYGYLYGPDDTARKGLSYRDVTATIAKRLAQKNLPALDQKRLRQIGYFFRTSASKEQFDAYLAGERALKALQKKRRRNQLTAWLDELLELKASLDEAAFTIKQHLK